VEQRRRLGATMRLNDADHDIDAFGLKRPRCRQHGVCFAGTGSHAEKDFELAARFIAGKLKKCFCENRRSPVVLLLSAMPYPAPRERGVNSKIECQHINARFT
jgi:hypothetical protein